MNILFSLDMQLASVGSGLALPLHVVLFLHFLWAAKFLYSYHLLISQVSLLCSYFCMVAFSVKQCCITQSDLMFSTSGLEFCWSSFIFSIVLV